MANNKKDRRKMQRDRKNKIKKIETYKIIILSLLIIIAFSILVILSRSTYGKLLKKNTFINDMLSFARMNEKTVFSIDKVTFFSSCDTKNKNIGATNFTIENLYSYTDIALFINSKSEEHNEENTLKSLKITNVKISKEPKLGEPAMYFKSINNFAKSDLTEENKIDNELNFEITSSDNVALDKPMLYNNCANPITLSYVNQNIKTDYTMLDTTNPIIYNGKLLERCNVKVEDIDASVSFDVEIENNKNQKFRTTVYFDIPYKADSNSILDGSITVKKDTDFKFYRYE